MSIFSPTMKKPEELNAQERAVHALSSGICEELLSDLAAMSKAFHLIGVTPESAMVNVVSSMLEIVIGNVVPAEDLERVLGYIAANVRSAHAHIAAERASPSQAEPHPVPTHEGPGTKQ